MEVYVRVISRNIETREEKLTTESFVTMVAVDDDGKPKPVPAIYPETDAEKRLFETGPARREHRKQKRNCRIKVKREIDVYCQFPFCAYILTHLPH